MKEGYRKIVRVWLVIGAFLVIAMVVVGGITRLTHSGLSMTDWKPISGVIPPLSQEDWEEEFDNYKQFPEYEKKHFDFTLNDFKSIFWWEYIHRVLGRFVGMVFIFPFAFFLFRKVFNRKWNIRLVILFLLGGLQGIIGWFMVKSGLVDNPDVSHYRLAIHLFAALTVFSYILWLYLDATPGFKKIESKNGIKSWSIALLVILVVQIIYGAFTAGLKAGLIINTWPLMGNKFVSPIVGQAFDSTGLISLIEEPVTVQFIHRLMPLILLIPIIILYRRSRESQQLRTKINWVGIIWLVQAALGIITLLTRVPVTMGVLHQLGGVVLLAAVVIVLHQVFSSATKQASRN